MPEPGTAFRIQKATADFHLARRRAVLEDIVARLRRRSNSLLSFEEMRHKLHGSGQILRGLQEIPLDAIVGSVGRYTDFTRHFLPRNDWVGSRWANVMVATTDRSDVPPIDVYQIGAYYFVSDGNHRISVARELGIKHIAAYVTEIETRIPFDLNQPPDELIISSEYADFVELTQCDKLFPRANLNVTVPGQYPAIVAHIHALGNTGSLEPEKTVMTERTVRTWFETIYKPVIAIIRENGSLRDFPNRTETDLYVWIVEHHAALEEELGWQINRRAAAADLVRRRSPQPDRVVARVRERLLNSIRPDLFEAGPPLGAWRQERTAAAENDKLFTDILVSVNGQEAGWWALAQAIGIARREHARLAGLFIVRHERERESEAAHAVRLEFDKRCTEAGIEGRFAVDSGGIAQLICDRARWTDLVVIKSSYPPGPHPLKRFRSGLRALIQRCSRPLLIVTDTPTQLHHGLLSYDGSPKSQEALYMAAYMAKQWQIRLSVLTVVDGVHASDKLLENARDYLTELDVPATYLVERGTAAASILNTAEKQDCDLIITGSYKYGPTREIILGSTVDHLLRTSYLPVLVCR